MPIAYFEKKANADRVYEQYYKKGYDMRKGKVKHKGKTLYYVEVRR